MKVGFRVAPMEGTQVLDSKACDEVISEKASQKKDETLDEVLSRHR